MFDKNDKALLITRKIIIVVLSILVVGILVLSIIMASIASPIFLVIWPVGWFACWIMWVVARLYLSYLCDIKLIRNKLYNTDNENLKVFLMAKPTPAQIEEQKRAAEEKVRNAERMKALLDSGVITEEEYIRETGSAPVVSAAPQSVQGVTNVSGGIDSEKLAKLKALLDSGVLTEDEYIKEIEKLTK